MKRNHGILSTFKKGIATLVMIAALAASAGAQEAVSVQSKSVSPSILDFPGKV